MKQKAYLAGLALALLPACLQAADRQPTMFRTEPVSTRSITADCSCAGCNSCCFRLIPTLRDGMARLLDRVFSCPSCCDQGTAECYAGGTSRHVPAPLLSFNFGRISRCSRAAREGCGTGPTRARLDQPLPARDPATARHAIDSRGPDAPNPSITRLVIDRAAKSHHAGRRQSNRSAPVATATWISEEPQPWRTAENEPAHIMPISGTDAIRQVPGNPLRK